MIYFKYADTAFIIPEDKVDILLGRADMVENGQNLFRAINFNIGKLKWTQGCFKQDLWYEMNAWMDIMQFLHLY